MRSTTVKIETSIYGGTLVEIEADSISLVALVDGDADPEEIAEAVDSLDVELDHSVRVSRGPA